MERLADFRQRDDQWRINGLRQDSTDRAIVLVVSVMVRMVVAMLLLAAVRRLDGMRSVVVERTVVVWFNGVLPVRRFF